MMTATDDNVTHLIAQMGLRAPRVVLLVPGWHDWHLMACNGIHTLTTMWGGAGWLVVPVVSAEVNPALLAALREYDPDAVLIPAASSFVPRSDMAVLHDAQQAISTACANYRSPVARSIAKAGVRDVSAAYLSTSGPGALTQLADVADTSIGQTIGANPALGGALGVCAAGRFGSAEAPKRPAANVNRQLANRAIFQLLSRSNFVGSLVGVTTRDSAQGDFTTDFDRTTYGLSRVFEGGPDDRPPALVVWGDDPDDFALAMAWDRIYGNGIWLPDKWWGNTATRPQVITAIDFLASTALHRFQGELTFTSTSLSRKQLSNRIQGCDVGGERRLGEPLIRPPDEAMMYPAEAIRFSRFHKTWFAIGRSNASQWSTAVHEKSGSVEFAMLPPLPDSRLPELNVIEAKAKWHVDINVVGHQIPCTTAVREQDLLAGQQSSLGLRIRSSRRGGVSFEAHDSWIVMGGASLEERLTRPFLRYPSLLDWAQARADAHGLSTKLSTAGYRADVLAKLIGSRANLSELIAGELLPALQAFNAKGPTSKEFPNDEGCVVNGEAYLNFAGMCEKAGIDVDAAARDQIDELVRAGLLHRGLIVNCAACAHVAFVPVEDVATTIRCQRCRTDNPLTRERWHLPDDEPRWFYDLHPTARAFLKSSANGHVPLLLSRHLRTRSQWHFTDAPEFELIKNGTPVAETDLLALYDRRLISAEAKTTNALGKNRTERNDAARKRVLAAEVLVTDQIVLATTKDSWEKASVESMKSAISAEDWHSGVPPRLRIVTGLGTASIADRFDE
jgi:hypothetical protein